MWKKGMNEIEYLYSVWNVFDRLLLHKKYKYVRWRFTCFFSDEGIIKNGQIHPLKLFNLIHTSPTSIYKTNWQVNPFHQCRYFRISLVSVFLGCFLFPFSLLNYFQRKYSEKTLSHDRQEFKGEELNDVIAFSAVRYEI